MQILTKELLKLFRSKRESYHSTRAMAKEFGLSDSMLSRILRGQVSHLRDAAWEKCKMKLEPGWCLHGFSACPLNGQCELRNLLKTLTKIKDPAVYCQVESFIKDKFLKKKGGQT